MRDCSIASCFARFDEHGSAASNLDNLGPRLELWRDESDHNPDASYSIGGMRDYGGHDGKPPASMLFGSWPFADGDENNGDKISSV